MSFPSTSRRRTRRVSPVARATCETLETRRMFVTYQVTGTNGDNAISISINGNSIISAVDGVSDSASDIVNNNIEISGMGGNDIISITETGNNTVVVFGGNGNDTINIGNGANDLGVIDGRCTINGDGGTDSLVLFDQNGTAQLDRAFFDDIVMWNGIHMVHTTAESVTLNTTTNADQTVRVYDDFNAADLTVNGNAARQQTIEVINAAAPTYSPDGVVSKNGSIDMDGVDVDFTLCDVVGFVSCGAATLVSPNANDAIVVSGTAEYTAFSGTSGGVLWAAPRAYNVGSFTLDLATHDAGAGNDVINGTAGLVGNALIRVNAGTGNNSLNATAGSWNLTSALGIGGANLDVTVSNTAVVAFNGAQTLRNVAINNGGTLALSNNLSAQQVSVNAGSGNISVGTGVVGVLLPGTLAIGAGRTLNKNGSGTLTVNSTQAHGANAFFENNAGTTNFNTDCGSSSVRPLNLFADSGNINLNATQHVNSVDTNFGNINVGTNGNRVLVTNAASVGGEGGVINLNDNDMIFDYAPGNVAADAAVRALLHTGRANGNWNGLGINSAAAASNPLRNTTLGFMEATEYQLVTGGLTTFDGQALDNSALVIKYTYYGDANFSGRVTFDDYVRTDIGFNQQHSGWINGDFNDSGTVNFDDYVLIDSAFNNQTVTLGRGLPLGGASPKQGSRR
jgi:hypothetical protein